MSAGNGAADPGPIDLSARPFPTSGRTFYEQFGSFDLSNQLVEAINLGSSYVLTDGSCATAARYGQTCMPLFSMLFTPNGSGGYAITRSTAGAWNSAFGASLGLTDDSLSGPLALGFPFTFPGGQTSGDIEVDSNGRILIPGTDTTDLSPSVSELLTETWPVLAPFWTDLNPASGGDVRFNVATGVPTVTWVGVPQYATSTAHTFQVQLYPGNAFRFSYLDTASFDPTADSLLVGISGGNGAPDPGETDFSAALPISTAAGTVAYEFFDGGLGEVPDFTDAPFSLGATGRPVINGPFGLGLTGLPATSVAAFFLLGFTNPNQDLGFLGLDGCVLLSSGEVALPRPITAGAAALSLNIPNNTSLAGASLYFQSAVVTPNANPLSLLFSNGVRATLNLN
jgi:hypothetical protein